MMFYDMINRILLHTHLFQTSNNKKNLFSFGRKTKVSFYNPVYANDLSIPPENIRKPLVFKCFEGVYGETTCIK